MEVAQIARLLNDTLNPDGNVVRGATESLDRLSRPPHFPLTLLSISIGGEDQGLKVSAATYLKNFTRRIVDTQSSNSNVSKEFKDQLIRTLLQVEPAVLKVLVEVFRIVVIAEFVKQNSWPEIVPDLRYAIQNSNIFSNSRNCGWNSINTLSVLQSLVRPFQYFLNPKVAKEPVPPRLELITEEILVPLLTTFNHLVEKALSSPDGTQIQIYQALLIICKSMHLTVSSHAICINSTFAFILP